MDRNRYDIREGYEVYDSSNNVVGRVRRWAENVLDLGDQRIPGAGISRVEGNRVYLSGTIDSYRTGSASSTDMRETDREIHVPVVEEQLNVEKRSGQIGEVRINRQVTEEERTVPVDLRREEVHVERRDVEDRPLRAGEADDAFQEGTIRVPVRGEEAIVSKETVVTGEVVINKEQTTERQEIRDTVRRQEVDVDEDYQRARGDFQQHFTQRQGAATTDRTFDEAETNYRYGWQTARDPRFADRDFDEVETDVREQYRSSGNRDDNWEHLREEIREGWNRVRNR